MATWADEYLTLIADCEKRSERLRWTMERSQHPTNNAVLGAPPGMSIESCGALPITRVVFQDGDQACVSFWRPSAAELRLLNAGRPVRLCVMGTTHAPLSVGVDGDEVLL